MNDSDLQDPWTERAAKWPVAFAQVREDPRSDLEVLRRVREPASVVMIASGGDTAALLGREKLRQLVVVDVNPAQLALTRLKWLLAQRSSPDESLALLGHRAMDPLERQAHLGDLLKELRLPEAVLGPIGEVAELGPDFAGRYEMLFAELRRELTPHATVVNRILGSTDASAAAALAAPQTAFGTALDDALGRVMALPNLVRLFGTDATQNPRQPFHRHFAERLRWSLTRHPAATNPFLGQLLGGRFPPGHPYDWLERSARPQCPPVFQRGRFPGVLDGLPPESADLVHLSNILDWLSADEAAECLRRAGRVLRSGGRIIVRQLNSTLDIPALPAGLRWDPELSTALHAADRSFFYSAIHIGQKP